MQTHTLIFHSLVYAFFPGIFYYFTTPHEKCISFTTFYRVNFSNLIFFYKLLHKLQKSNLHRCFSERNPLKKVVYWFVLVHFRVQLPQAKHLFDKRIQDRNTNESIVQEFSSSVFSWSILYSLLWWYLDYLGCTILKSMHRFAFQKSMLKRFVC